MRVLYLAHREADYGGAFLFNGLCRAIGSENVYDYPIKPSYHGQDDNNYPRPWCNEGPGSTGRFPWFEQGYPAHPYPAQYVHLTDIETKLRDGFFDLVILESWRWTVQQSWEELKDDIRASGAKVILHDGEDFSQFNMDALNTVNPDVYLKRELLKGYDFSNQSGPIVLPFPFSAPDQIVEWADAQPPATIERDIACLLGISWEPRRELAAELRRGIEAGEFTGYVATSDPPQESLHSLKEHPLLGFWEYLELLRTSRFGVSMRGFGWDSCRAWEIAVLTGLLVDNLDIQIPYPFSNGCNSSFYQSIAHCRDLAGQINAYADAVQEIREAGIAHARTHHTNSARVKWLLEEIIN
jgi:hypothetical protein